MYEAVPALTYSSSWRNTSFKKEANMYLLYIYMDFILGVCTLPRV
jgi:hypothetical protein